MNVILVVTLVATCQGDICERNISEVSEEFCEGQVEWFKEIDPEEEKYKARCIPLESWLERLGNWWEKEGE